jgi:FtsP/CotA-like multicopper oxidase with cupredoxin domain
MINGETWDSFKIAAEDVGHNTWELWKLETGGGWFHPVHMHLVDFFILKVITQG